MRAALLWIGYVLLLGIFGQTLAAHWILYRDPAPLAWAVACLPLLVLLFYAEGLELAVADLGDKDPSQIRDSRVHDTLKEIQGRAEFFYANRQIVVVAVIAFITMTLDFDFLYIWPLGEIRHPFFRFAFNLSFVTLTVLWFCQVTPKRLAIINSELFLAHGRFVWPLVKAISLLDLPSPTDNIVALFRRLSGYRNRRLLNLSRSTLYTYSAKNTGIALDTLKIDVTIREDGTVQLKERNVIVFLCGHHYQLHGRLPTGCSGYGLAEITTIDIRPVFAGTTPSRENLSEISPQLDALGATDPRFLEFAESLPSFSENMIDKLKFQVICDVGEAFWNINLNTALPEGLATFESAGAIQDSDLAVLVYDVIAECTAGFFSTIQGQDAWIENVSYPCRKLSLHVHADPNCNFRPVLRHCTVGLGNMSCPLESEQARCTNAFMETVDANSGCIEFPVQGAVYRIQIDFLQEGAQPRLLAPPVRSKSQPEDA
jgi:hypothetical protein